MDLEKIYQIKEEKEQVNELYNIFQEDDRLSHSPAAKIEFLTTVRYVEKYLKKGMRILDLGAGTGAYSLYFAQEGYQVDALELADNNVRIFREKIKEEYSVNLQQGDATDLSRYADESFDIVLLMGPLYHLHSKEDRSRCIREAKRVLKSTGILFVSFINHDMIFMTELRYDQKFFERGHYDHETMRLEDFPFVFFQVSESRKMLEEERIEILRAVATDGASELMAKEINSMDEENYTQYLKYHFYRCEREEMLGFSNHLLLIGRKERI